MKCFQMLLFIEKAFIFVLLWPVSRFTAQQPHQSHTNNKSAEPATKLKFRKSEISSIIVFVCCLISEALSEIPSIAKWLFEAGIPTASTMLQSWSSSRRGLTRAFNWHIFHIWLQTSIFTQSTIWDGWKQTGLEKGNQLVNYTAMRFHVIIKCMLSMWQWLCFTCLRKFKKCILLKAQKV